MIGNDTEYLHVSTYKEGSCKCFKPTLRTGFKVARKHSEYQCTPDLGYLQCVFDMATGKARANTIIRRGMGGARDKRVRERVVGTDYR